VLTDGLPFTTSLVVVRTISLLDYTVGVADVAGASAAWQVKANDSVAADRIYGAASSITAVNLTPRNLDPTTGEAGRKLTYWPSNFDDIIYGLGNLLRSGAGNDLGSSAEALTKSYTRVFPPNTPHPVDVVRSDYTRPFSPGDALVGNDSLFDDLGSDWIVGGTGKDRAYCGWADDLFNMDYNRTTSTGLNDDAASYENVAYGAAGRDVGIGKAGADRLIDCVSEFNFYIVPFSRGPPLVGPCRLE
jgi:hypothetical protein